MRVLHEKECAAVAGGHDPGCEAELKTAFIVGGGLAGGAIGAWPGVAVGAGVGALAADAFGHQICAASQAEREQLEREEAEQLAEEMDALYIQQYVNWSQQPAFGNSPGAPSTGPHELVVDTGSY